MPSSMPGGMVTLTSRFCGTRPLPAHPLAGRVDHLTHAVATRARGAHGEKALRAHDLSAAAAVGARLRRGARLGAGAAADLARLVALDLDLALDAGAHLFERDFQVDLQVGAAGALSASTASAAPAKELLEDGAAAPAPPPPKMSPNAEKMSSIEPNCCPAPPTPACPKRSYRSRFWSSLKTS